GRRSRNRAAPVLLNSTYFQGFPATVGRMGRIRGRELNTAEQGWAQPQICRANAAVRNVDQAQKRGESALSQVRGHARWWQGVARSWFFEAAIDQHHQLLGVREL